MGKAEVDQPLLYQSGFMSTRPAELQGKRDLVTVPYGAKGADGGSAQRLTSSDGRDEAKGDRAFEGVRVKRVTYHRSGMGVGHWSTPHLRPPPVRGPPCGLGGNRFEIGGGRHWVYPMSKSPSPQGAAN